MDETVITGNFGCKDYDVIRLSEGDLVRIESLTHEKGIVTDDFVNFTVTKPGTYIVECIISTIDSSCDGVICLRTVSNEYVICETRITGINVFNTLIQLKKNENFQIVYHGESELNLLSSSIFSMRG